MCAPGDGECCQPNQLCREERLLSRQAGSAAPETHVARAIASASRAMTVALLVRCARPVVAYVARWLASAGSAAWPRPAVPGRISSA